MLLVLALFTIPFVQIGYSFWVSGAQLAMLLVLLHWGRGLTIAGLQHLWILLPVPFLFLSLIWARTTNFDSELLRIAREAVLYVVIAVALVWSARPNFSVRLGNIEKLIAYICLAFLALSVLQVIFYSQGVYFGLPRDWFIHNADTLADVLDLYYSRIRPNGTYGEPSYFGFVLLSFMVAVTPRLKESFWAKVVYGAALAAGLMSRSLAFVLAAMFVLGLPFFMAATLSTRLKLIAVALVGLVPLLLFTPAFEVLGRLGSGSSELGDTSIYARIVAPLLVLPEYFLAFPLGVPIQSVELQASAFNLGGLAWPEIMHNALFNAVFTYGVFGVVLFAILIQSARTAQLAGNIIASTMFNGAFFAFDKIVVVVIASVIYCARTAEAEKRIKAAAPEIHAPARRGRRRTIPAGQQLNPGRSLSQEGS